MALDCVSLGLEGGREGERGRDVSKEDEGGR